MTGRVANTSPIIVFLYALAVRTCQQVGPNSYQGCATAVRANHYIEEGEAMSQSADKAAAAAEQFAQTSAHWRCPAPATVGIPREVVEQRRRPGSLQEWSEVVATAAGHLASALQFFPKLEEEKAGQNAEGAVKNKDVTARTRGTRQGVLEAARALIAALRNYAVPFLYTFTPTRPADAPSGNVIAAGDARSMIVSSEDRVITGMCAWAPKPTLGLATQ